MQPDFSQVIIKIEIMKKGLFSLVFAFAAVFASAQCDPVSSIDENFDDWEAINECWTGVANGGMFMYGGDLTFYTFMQPNVSMYLISPEIVAGDYTLTFDFGTVSMDGEETEGITVEAGTLTTNANTDSFVSLGAPQPTTIAPQSMELPVSFASDVKYFVIKVHGASPHSAAFVDNVVLAPTTAGVNDLNTVKVQAYPNPVINQLNLTADQNLREASIFNAAGQLVQTAKLSGKSSSVNVSALKAGVYVVQIKTEKGVQTLKVVKK